MFALWATGLIFGFGLLHHAIAPRAAGLWESVYLSGTTFTTLGYGDVTPTRGIGRIIGSVVLLYSVAFLTILTAAITTSFVDRARVQRQGTPDARTTNALLEDIVARLDALERRLPR